MGQLGSQTRGLKQGASDVQLGITQGIEDAGIRRDDLNIGYQRTIDDATTDLYGIGGTGMDNLGQSGVYGTGGTDAMGETDGSSKGYFSELIPIYDNPYLQQKKTVENAYPDKMEFHPVKKFIWGKKKSKELTLKSKCWTQSTVPGNEWSKLLPTPPYTSIRFKQTYTCLWEFIMEIINDFTGKTNDIAVIKQTLISEYQKLDMKHVRIILACQGKRKLVTSIDRGADIDAIIINQDYYISNLDLFLLAQYYKIPFVLIGGKKLYENFKSTVLKKERNIAAYLHDGVDYYYIIHAQMPKINKPAKYSIIQKNNNIRISKMDVPDLFKKYVRENDREVTFADYFKTFYKSMDNRFCLPHYTIIPKGQKKKPVGKNKFKKRKKKLSLKGKVT